MQRILSLLLAGSFIIMGYSKKKGDHRYGIWREDKA